MAVHFKNNRLHVGYRDKDWSKVWFEPDLKTKNEEDETDLLLYHLVAGKAKKREPMPGEVRWLPHFDPSSFGSSSKEERKRLQAQFLTDAYEYLMEKDPIKVQEMEQRLDQPGFSRWQTWFEEAKKFKKTWLSRKQPRRQRRANMVREAGMEETEIEINSDTTDSAYISDDEDGMPMAQPITNKRKKGGDSNRWTASAKRSKPDHGRGVHSKTPYMSGALGFQMPERYRSDSVMSASTTRPRVNSHEPNDNEFDHETMDLRDSTGPPPVKPTYAGGWSFDELGRTPPPSGAPRALGRSSRKASLTGESGHSVSRLQTGEIHQTHEANEAEDDIEQAE